MKREKTNARRHRAYEFAGKKKEKKRRKRKRKKPEKDVIIKRNARMISVCKR